MMNIAILAMLLPLTLNQGYLGKTMDVVAKDLGPYEASTWEPGLTEYRCKTGNLHLCVVPVNGIIQKVHYKWADPPEVETTKRILAECLGSKPWEEAESISVLEIKDLDRQISHESCKKYMSTDRTVTAYSYTLTEKSHPHRMVIFTDRFLVEQARAIPPHSTADPYFVQCDYQESRLKYGYLTYSVEFLDKFLDIWEGQSKPLDRSVVKLPKVVDAAYQIFEDFYTPKNLKRVGYKSKKNSNLYEECRCLVVQNGFDIHLRTDFERLEKSHDYKLKPFLKMTVKDIRPDIQIHDSICLYLNDAYEKILLTFLGDEQLSVGHVNIMDPARETGESANRVKFLNRRVHILKSHWMGWHLASHPYIFSIDFNANRDQAEVHFRVRYQGGTAKYRKHDSRWEMVESRLTWIE